MPVFPSVPAEVNALTSTFQPMQLSKATLEFLASLETLSNHKLTRRNDLGVLLELAALHNQHALLEDLCFLAKFVSKTFGILQRIDKSGEGYDKLSHEFTETLAKTKTLVSALLSAAPRATRQSFTSTYLNMTHESLQHLLALCYDLSWYKNWLIDHPEQHR